MKIKIKKITYSQIDVNCHACGSKQINYVTKKPYKLSLKIENLGECKNTKYYCAGCVYYIRSAMIKTIKKYKKV